MTHLEAMHLDQLCLLLYQQVFPHLQVNSNQEGTVLQHFLLGFPHLQVNSNQEGKVLLDFQQVFPHLQANSNLQEAFLHHHSQLVFHLHQAIWIYHHHHVVDLDLHQKNLVTKKAQKYRFLNLAKHVTNLARKHSFLHVVITIIQNA